MKNRKIVIYVVMVVVVLVGIALSVYVGRNNLPNWALGYFVEQEDANPVIIQDTSSGFYCPAIEKNIKWESGGISHPSVTVYNEKIVLFYQGQDSSGDKEGRNTSRIGYAVSSDGLSFEKDKEPVVYPDRDEQVKHEWMGGCEDPRIAVTKDGTYVMFYTQSNRYTSRLAVALSKDLKTWTKYGPIFEDAYNGKYYNISTKSASIVTEISGGKQVISKVNGHYFMYWGDNNIYAATSDNLIDWQPVEDENGELNRVLTPRQNCFDSKSLACGPSAVMTEKGIVLLYNGENRTGESGDQQYSQTMIAGGQALFDLKEPAKLLARLNKPFIFPKKSIFSKDTLAVDDVVSIQGLVYFKNQWYLYYGDENSQINVAIYNPAEN